MRVGDVVGERFELFALAGSGGMGEVYRALDRETGATVALKVVLGAGALHAFAFAPAHVLGSSPQWRMISRSEFDSDTMTVYAPLR